MFTVVTSTFDLQPEFFRVKRNEAVTLDPQHRLLLEETYMALVNAGADATAQTTGTFQIWLNRFEPTPVYVSVASCDRCKLNLHFMCHTFQRIWVQNWLTGDNKGTIDWL